MSPQIVSSAPQSMDVAEASSRAPVPAGNVGFSDEELRALHHDDYSAGRFVVCIMGAVFSMGLALYIFIAFMVASGGH